MEIQQSQRYHTPPPKVEDLGDGSSYYNFDVVQNRSEDDDHDVFEYFQVRVLNPVTLERVQAALAAEGYEHSPELDEDGHAPDPEDETGGVPQIITSRQLRLGWVMSGHSLSDIDSAIDQLPDPFKEIARINWEYAGTFDRSNELLLNVADALGITTEQLDQLFIDASVL